MPQLPQCWITNRYFPGPSCAHQRAHACGNCELLTRTGVGVQRDLANTVRRVSAKLPTQVIRKTAVRHSLDRRVAPAAVGRAATGGLAPHLEHLESSAAKVAAAEADFEFGLVFGHRS